MLNQVQHAVPAKHRLSIPHDGPNHLGFSDLTLSQVTVLWGTTNEMVQPFLIQ